MAATLIFFSLRAVISTEIPISSWQDSIFVFQTCFSSSVDPLTGSDRTFDPDHAIGEERGWRPVEENFSSCHGKFNISNLYHKTFYCRN